jgi:hypothetical protein
MGAWLMARSFREAEEASNAQGTVQAALDFAMQNAKKNPTPENIAIMKDTAAARQATVAAQPKTDYTQVLKNAQKDVTDIKSTIDTINQNITDVNIAGNEVGDISKSMGGPAFSPIGTVAGGSKSSFDQDAFAKLMAQLNQWNLGSLSGVITQLLEEGNTFDSVLTKIKYDSSINAKTGKAYNDAYTIRFAGNKSRISKGLNALSEQEYMQNENSYAETLKAYGLNTMLSTDRSVNEAKFAGYIANDMSPSEFKDRIDLASTRVMNMDPAIMRNFQQYYPQVNKTDLVSYFLAPEETMQLLETKVTASEIGAAANQQGLSVSGTRAEEFAKMGQTYAGAQRDYSNIAEVLPTTEKLGGIYGEEGIKYTQATAEDEYIKQDAAAKLKRNRLASKERASFEGSAGAAQGAFSTSYLKKSSAAGQI